jgi:hypothetical protein
VAFIDTLSDIIDKVELMKSADQPLVITLSYGAEDKFIFAVPNQNVRKEYLVIEDMDDYLAGLLGDAEGAEKAQKREQLETMTAQRDGLNVRIANVQAELDAL